MEWLTCVRTAIDYIEKHLTDDISVQDVAESKIGRASCRERV
mgnify:CR=1 FL=1